MDHPFRGAVFGGFNRQDVLTYLENASHEAAQRQSELEKQLDEAQALRAQQDAQLAEQTEQLARLRQENQELQTRLEQAQQALSASRDQCGRHSGELDAARRELEELKGRMAALEPDAAAYSAVKDRTAGMELEAHRRAQAIQDQAEGQARQIRRRAEQWLREVGLAYDALRRETESTAAHAADRLDKAGKALAQVNELLEQQGAAWERLSQEYLAGEEPPAQGEDARSTDT